MSLERRAEIELGLNLSLKGVGRANVSKIQLYKKKSIIVLQEMKKLLNFMGRDNDRPVGDYLAEWAPWNNIATAREAYFTFLRYALEVVAEYNDWLETDVYEL